MTDGADEQTAQGWASTATIEENAGMAADDPDELVSMIEQEPTCAGRGEILPLAFLETPQEAVEVEAGEEEEDAFEAVARRHTERMAAPAPSTVRRSSRSRKSEPKVLSERQKKLQRRAKIILYGGISIAALLVLVLASYKLPLILYPKYMDTPYVWPWPPPAGWEEEEEADAKEELYRLPDGTTFDRNRIDELKLRATKILNEARDDFEQAKVEYADGKRVDALVTMTRAMQKVDPLEEELEEVLVFKMFQRINKKAAELIEEIGYKMGSWKKGLDVNEGGEYIEALKREGLLPQPEGDGEAEPASEAQPAQDTEEDVPF